MNGVSTRWRKILLLGVPGLPLGLGLVATLLVGQQMQRSFETEAHTAFERRAYFLAAAAERSLEQGSALSRYLAGYMGAVRGLTARAFREFVVRTVPDIADYVRITWVSKVPHSRLDAYLARRLAINGPDAASFALFGLDLQTGDRRTEGIDRLAVHYPITYSVVARNLPTLEGFDWATLGKGHTLFEMAQARQDLVASPIIQGEAVFGETSDIIAFVTPVLHRDITASRTVQHSAGEPFDGYATISLFLQETVERAFKGFELNDLRISLSDGARILDLSHPDAQSLQADGRMTVSLPISVPGGQQWQMHFASTAATPGPSLAPLLSIYAFGLFATLAATAGALLLARQHRIIRREVDTKTHALQAANQDLVHQSIQLNKLAAEAQEANRAKSHFLASMSHELRTPLNAIIGFSSVMGEEMFGPHGHPKYADYARDIHKSGEDLLAIVQDLLDVGRLEADRLTVDKAWIDLDRLIQSTVRTIQGGIGPVARLFASQSSPGPLCLYADERLVRQSLLNLLSNAVKFSPPGSRIDLRACLDPTEGLTVAVRDRGTGIAAEDLQRVLKPFVKSDDPYRRNTEGVGLGLALVKGFVEANDGRIEIDSTPGEGTEVRLIFPAAAARLRDPVAERQSALSR